MQIRLNLATKPLLTHRRFLVASNFTIFLAIIAFLALGWHVYNARKIDSEIRTRTSALRKEQAQIEAQQRELLNYFHQKDIADLKDRADFINAFLDARSFNWTLMFMDLEHLLPGGVRVISIEPHQAGNRVEVKITFGASNDEAELKFEHALEGSKVFSEVQIQSVHKPNGIGNTSGDQVVIQLTTFYSRS